MRRYIPRFSIHGSFALFSQKVPCIINPSIYCELVQDEGDNATPAYLSQLDTEPCRLSEREKTIDRLVATGRGELEGLPAGLC